DAPDGPQGTLAAGTSDSPAFVGGTLTVTKAALTITADDKTMVAGGKMPPLTASYSGLVNGDTASVVQGLALSTVAAASPPGTYAITASGATAADYDITFKSGTLTVVAPQGAALRDSARSYLYAALGYAAQAANHGIYGAYASAYASYAWSYANLPGGGANALYLAFVYSYYASAYALAQYSQTG